MDVKVGVDGYFGPRQVLISRICARSSTSSTAVSAITRGSSSSGWSGALGMVVDLSFYALLAMAVVVHGAGHLPVGAIRWYVAPDDRRRACDCDRPGVEFHLEPAFDVQRREQGVRPAR